VVNEVVQPIAHPTLADVAAVAGVSIKTASRVLNDSVNVAPDTAEKVRKAATLVGYRSNRIARELRGGTLSNLIGMVISDLANPFYAGLAAGAEKRLSEAGLDLIIATARDDAEKERALIDSLLERRVRGLVIVPSGEDYSYLHIERKRGYSFVFVDRPAAYLDTDTVLVDNQGGIAVCLDELLRQKCKKIAIIADTLNIWTASERVEGFKRACLSRNVDQKDVHIITGVHTTEEAKAATHSLLGSTSRIDGIIATNDLIAMGVGEVIHKERSNIKVVSFDDFPSAEMFEIKSLDHDPQRLGRLAAEVLLKRMAKPTENKYVTEVMKLDLQSRTANPQKAAANG
jgi:LacI family transcriptional regulator